MSTLLPYLAEIGWKIDWQEFKKLPSADPVFLDNTQPQRGLNAKASRYSLVNGYTLHAAIEATMRKDGIDTIYRALSPASKANDYDVPSVSPRDFTCAITLHDIDTGNNLGTYIPNKDVIFRATYTLVNGGNIADYANAWAIHHIEIYPSLGYNDYELSSIYTRAVTGNPLKSDTGLVSVDYVADTIITECIVSGAMLNSAQSYSLTSRLGSPNTYYTPPEIEITGIVADTNTGIFDWQMNLTPGFGSFGSSDVIDLLVYNDTTNALLYTLTGFYGNDISTFTGGTIAGYLGGVISTASALTFDKLQWAIDNSLTNEDAISLRFEATITQAATGLVSNTDTGVFDIELQDAQYLGDLRYFDTDGRKIYMSGADGINGVIVGLDLTLKFSNELFTPNNGSQLTAAIVLGDSDFGTPWSELLVGEWGVGSPYQWLNKVNTTDGIAWSFTNLLSNIAGAGNTINKPLIDDIRTANGQPVFWVGMDLPVPKIMYMVYYDGAVWQAVDFSSKFSGIVLAAVVRVGACISYTGDVYGYCCANGTTGEKRIYRMLQTGGTKTTVSDFINPANWADATVMAGGVSAGTADGNGATARFANPYGMVLINDDGTRPSEIWVSDGNNYSVRQLVYNGGSDNYDVTTIVGLSGTSGDTNDTGTNARLGDVRGIIKSGTNVYIGDLGNLKIKKVVISTLAVTTFSGTGDSAYRVASLF